MATIKLNMLHVVGVVSTSALLYIAFLMHTRSEAVFNRTVNLDSSVFKAEDLQPNDLIVMSMPDADDRDVKEAEQKLRNLGVVNAVVINKNIEQFKKDKVNLDPDKDYRERAQ